MRNRNASRGSSTASSAVAVPARRGAVRRAPGGAMRQRKAGPGQEAVGPSRYGRASSIGHKMRTCGGSGRKGKTGRDPENLGSTPSGSGGGGVQRLIV